MLSTQGPIKSVLIVDDTFILRRAISSLLKRRGYLCEEVADGEEALEKVPNTHFDLVITDNQDPD